ncbi:MAG TPA: phosphoribosylamine--glycine ligase [Cyclobacteriaceae bacterium]|nr:phosphoribosylamine--glycine ligase [Cyclobacteriaceae bacterium]
MNILIIGSGGREHAFAWKVKQSQRCSKLFVAPGNAGTGAIATNVAIPVDNFEKLGQFCLDEKIDLVIVGPEVPLVNGIREHFERSSSLKHILMVGPGKTGAQLEGSKDFSKQFMLRNNIPTAKAKTFSSSTEAIAFLKTLSPPYVLKADGLAAGKGVVITSALTEAQSVVKDMLDNKQFGEASSRILIEEFLDGIELSVFILTDGKDYVILPAAKDYKRVGDGDQGPNTGGMGAVSPVIFANDEFMEKVESRVIIPTVNGLRKEGIDYRGFIFIGLMNVNGDPFVIEYNARMGDPETQVVMLRISSDFVEPLIATAEGKLKGHQVAAHPGYALTVSLVAGGYPGDYKKGDIISGHDQKGVFHAGTKVSSGSVVTDGGRVLSVTGEGPNLAEARKNAYSRISAINWDGLYFRNDIGLDLQKIEEEARDH